MTLQELIIKSLMILLASTVAISCAHQTTSDAAVAENPLPFDPPKPHADLQHLAFSDGLYDACSIAFDANEEVREEREHRVSVDSKVFGQARTIDYLLGREGNRTVQSAFVAYDIKAERIQEFVQSPIGYLEYWDQIPSGGTDGLTLQMRDKARLVQDGENAKSMLFRKTYQNINADYFETIVSVSEDDGATWRVMFHEFSFLNTDGSSDHDHAQCSRELLKGLHRALGST